MVILESVDDGAGAVVGSLDGVGLEAESRA